MGFHTFDVAQADRLEDAASRYRYLSEEELLAVVDPTGAIVADVGSGTGFYTESVADDAALVYAVDVQPGMHDRYREKGMSPNVRPVTAVADALPIPDSTLDRAFSTMTYHEFASEAALSELARALAPGGTAVHVDWSAAGDGESGPPLSERYDLEDAVAAHRDAGFDIRRAESRRETFLLVAER